MPYRLGQAARFGLLMIFMLVAGLMAPTTGRSAPYAALVMDARTGEVFHARNADTRLHPASLTKMMTLYIAFQAISRGEISLDTEVRITADAAAQPPSRLGLRTGQTIRMRYLIRAAAVKSANDAATAIGVAISGSQEAFAARMNATARAMGMTNTNFVSMNGLTTPNHYSSARDMSVLGRHVIYDFPQYYNLFSRRTADAGIAQVRNTNSRFLDSYEGADGIKTGFTNAAGYNLVASARRGDVRIIATVFGGTSTANRNARIAELLDLGFAAAPASATIRSPGEVVVAEAPEAAVAQEAIVNLPTATGAGHTIRVSGAVLSSLRPVPRPSGEEPTLVAASGDAVTDALNLALGLAVEEETVAVAPDQETALEADVQLALGQFAPDEVAVSPPARPTEIVMTSAAIIPSSAASTPDDLEVVTRVSTSGGRLWGINVGRLPTRDAAERLLIQVALAEPDALDGALRRVLQRSGGFDANFVGLTRDGADLACRRLQARGTTCFMVGESEG